MEVNDTILTALKRIADVYKSQGNVHKHKAYRNAIDTIRDWKTPIAAASELKGAKGIGKAMLEKIDEVIKTGGLAQEAEVMADPVNAALKLFTGIHGIGPVLARKLVHEDGLRTIEDLEGAHLPAQARMGLRYREDADQRIPFDEIETHLRYVTRVAAEVDARLAVAVCGSHRRRQATSGDIDVLLTHPGSHSTTNSGYRYLGLLAAALRGKGYVLDVLAEGDSKFMGYARLLPDANDDGEVAGGGRAGSRRRGGAAAPQAVDADAADADKPKHLVRRLDMRWVTFDQFPAALLYFTGSDIFNVRMREAAIKQGYKLNEYGLTEAKTGQFVACPTERSLFDALKMAYVEPHERSTI